MNPLLDTHTFLWWDSDPAQLSPRVRQICRDPNNLLWVSTASIWALLKRWALRIVVIRRPERPSYRWNGMKQ